eukprot:g6099.t1
MLGSSTTGLPPRPLLAAGFVSLTGLAGAVQNKIGSNTGAQFSKLKPVHSKIFETRFSKPVGPNVEDGDARLNLLPIADRGAPEPEDCSWTPETAEEDALGASEQTSSDFLARGRGASTGEGDLKVAVASYNILLDLQIPTNSAPYMKKQCQARASREQCLTNSGSLIAEYKKEGKPPIALLGVQEYLSPGKAPFLKGLGADWKLLTSHITCAVWYNEALVPNAQAPSAATVGNENDGPLVFLKKGLHGPDYYDSDPDGVRCAAAGYFPDQRLLFGSLWCVHPPGTDNLGRKVAGEHCIKAALSRFQKLADANAWNEYDRVIITMDSNDEVAKLLEFGSNTGWPLKTPSGKDLTLRTSSRSLKTCCYSDDASLTNVGDYIADTAEPDADPFIVPGAVSKPVGLRSDHLPVMKNVVLPGGARGGRSTKGAEDSGGDTDRSRKSTGSMCC